MIYHNLDLFLLQSILKSKTKISTWRLAKTYNWEDKTKERNEDYWKNKCNIVIKRLRKMEDIGLIIILKDKNKREYSIVHENVFFKKLRLPNKKAGNCLFIREIGEKWQIFEV